MAETTDPPPDDEARRPAAGPGSAEDRESAAWYRMAGVGFEFAVAVGMFAGLGWWLDRWLGVSPWLLIVGCGLGFAVGLFQLVRAANRMMK